MTPRNGLPAPMSPNAADPSTCSLYIPGHRVHFIQARLSWENSENDVPGVIESIEGQIVRVRMGGEVKSYRNHDLSHLAELSKETREVTLGSRGVLRCRNHFFCIARAEKPWTSCRGPSVAGNRADVLVDRLLDDGGFLVSAADLNVPDDGPDMEACV